jgi:Na+/melibiose symporter-like transporter
LWHAPRGWTAAGLLVFAVAMLIAVRVSVAAYEIPSTSLTPELAPDYDKRTSLLGLTAGSSRSRRSQWSRSCSTWSILRQDADNPLAC